VTDLAGPTVGHPAPAFKLPSSAGGELGPADFAGKQALVLYFYPKDDTAGCTAEACQFRDLQAAFAAKGAAIVGVSPDSLKSHAKFAGKHGLSFPLLADEGATVCRLYGVWKEKSMYGRRYMGVERTTFLIDRDGIVRKVYPKVSVTGHADAVLRDLAALQTT
jgi:peroxiredoxin Q/BCP